MALPEVLDEFRYDADCGCDCECDAHLGGFIALGHYPRAVMVLAARRDGHHRRDMRFERIEQGWADWIDPEWGLVKDDYAGRIDVRDRPFEGAHPITLAYIYFGDGHTRYFRDQLARRSA